MQLLNLWCEAQAAQQRLRNTFRESSKPDQERRLNSMVFSASLVRNCIPPARWREVFDPHLLGSKQFSALTRRLVLVVVLVLPTSPRRLKLREATSGRLSPNPVTRVGVLEYCAKADLHPRNGFPPRMGERTQARVLTLGKDHTLRALKVALEGSVQVGQVDNRKKSVGIHPIFPATSSINH